MTIGIDEIQKRIGKEFDVELMKFLGSRGAF
jgi:hypothetical protein